MEVLRMPAALGRRCMQMGPNSAALRVPVHLAAGLGGRQRRSPTGGSAKGTPLKMRTSGVVPATPERSPWSTRTGSVMAARSATTTVKTKKREMVFFMATTDRLKSRSSGWLPHQHVLRLHAGIHNHRKEAHHHFFPTLIAPSIRDVRIGIGGIVGGVVVMRHAFDPRALRHQERFGFLVSELPVEVVFRDAQQGF